VQLVISTSIIRLSFSSTTPDIRNCDVVLTAMRKMMAKRNGDRKRAMKASGPASSVLVASSMTVRFSGLRRRSTGRLAGARWARLARTKALN